MTYWWRCHACRKPGHATDCREGVPGGAQRTVLEALKRHFSSVQHAKPPAGRKESSELYGVATGFPGGAIGSMTRCWCVGKKARFITEDTEKGKATEDTEKP